MSGDQDYDEDDDFTPWTPEGAAAVRAAGAALVAALQTHVEKVAGASKPAHTNAVLTAGEPLIAACQRYADAQFEYTGIGSPFGYLIGLVDEDENETEDTDDLDDAEEIPTTGITVLRRADYAITDEDAVITAGRGALITSGRPTTCANTWPSCVASSRTTRPTRASC